jgi:hypothetical protein
MEVERGQKSEMRIQFAYVSTEAVLIGHHICVCWMMVVWCQWPSSIEIRLPLLKETLGD